LSASGELILGQNSVHYKAIWPLEKRTRRGFRGYPVATVAFYGPDDRRASKVAVGILKSEQAEAEPLERWWSESADVRSDRSVVEQVFRFIEAHQAKSVVMTDRIIGCPHEEGTDYPQGTSCPECPFWAGRDRWSGKFLQ
jgi:hypothetical protein